MMKKAILLMIMSMLLTVCFPADPLDAQAEGTQKGELPASFDLRSVDTDGDGVGDRCYVTPVRFQNPFATCWVFAGISAAEISLLGSVYADDPEAWKTLDLSEKQLGYFSHMLLNDPTSPQNGEGTTAADPTDMFEVYGGGSTLMALEAFAQGVGPSDEHPDLPNIGEAFEYHGKERTTVLDYIDGAFRGFHYFHGVEVDKLFQIIARCSVQSVTLRKEHPLFTTPMHSPAMDVWKKGVMSNEKECKTPGSDGRP